MLNEIEMLPLIVTEGKSDWGGSYVKENRNPTNQSQVLNSQVAVVCLSHEEVREVNDILLNAILH
jgi:hypothetical protein